MKNTFDINQARSFLEAVRQHATIGKGIATELFLTAKRRNDDLAGCAAGVGVMQTTLLQWAFGMRDLFNADAHLVERIQEYLGVDLGVLQIAVGRLSVADFEVSVPHRPCDNIRDKAESWLATGYATSLRQLAAEFTYPQMTRALTEFPPLELVNCDQASQEWESLESDESSGNALLSWLAHTGKTISCTPYGMCKHLGRPPCWIHLMFTGRGPVSHLPSSDLVRVAHFLAVPQAVVMAAAGQLGQAVQC